jgi:hypothetical protein
MQHAWTCWGKAPISIMWTAIAWPQIRGRLCASSLHGFALYPSPNGQAANQRSRSQTRGQSMHTFKSTPETKAIDVRKLQPHPCTKSQSVQIKGPPTMLCPGQEDYSQGANIHNVRPPWSKARVMEQVHSSVRLQYGNVNPKEQWHWHPVLLTFSFRTPPSSYL